MIRDAGIEIFYRNDPPPPGQTPPGQTPHGQTPPPPADVYCSRRYASYWNAFLSNYVKFIDMVKKLINHRSPFSETSE